jgi:hypothetical protein
MSNLLFIAITFGAIGVALRLERRHILYTRLSSALLVMIIGYILGSFRLVEANTSILAWVTELILPLTLVSALLSMARSSTPAFTLRLMRGTGYTMVLTVILGAVFMLFSTNQLVSKGIITEFTSNVSLLLSTLTPKDPYSLLYSQNKVYQAIALTVNALSISVAVLAPVILQTAYKTVWLYVPLEEAAERRMQSRIDYSSKSSQNLIWSLGLSLSIAVFTLVGINLLTELFHPLPKEILILCIPLLLRPFAGIQNMANEFEILATLGSHVFIFSYGLILGSCPWQILSAGTVFLTVMLLIVHTLVVLIAGHRFGINIETLCVLFLAVTCGPLVAATVCTAKKWEPLLPVAFLLGFIAQIVLWLACVGLF